MKLTFHGGAGSVTAQAKRKKDREIVPAKIDKRRIISTASLLSSC